LSKTGWIIKADTIKELASKIGMVGMTAEALENTIAKYNEYCKLGKDIEFSRDPKTMEPINQPPYYAMPLVPNFVNTQGGPRHNDKAQVMNPYNEPIRRLYSSGELGSIYGFLYEGGGDVGECMAFGRIEGGNAAAEKSLK
jgi:succinate dehydrogenase/fumarate reductase flavoprotein subunit